MAAASIDLEARMNILLAVSRYLRAVDRHAKAAHEMTDACSELRVRLNRPSRFVTRIDFQHFLVTSDDQGNFDVEQIEAL